MKVCVEDNNCYASFWTEADVGCNTIWFEGHGLTIALLALAVTWICYWWFTGKSNPTDCQFSICSPARLATKLLWMPWNMVRKVTDGSILEWTMSEQPTRSWCFSWQLTQNHLVTWYGADRIGAVIDALRELPATPASGTGAPLQDTKKTSLQHMW